MKTEPALSLNMAVDNVKQFHDIAKKVEVMSTTGKWLLEKILLKLTNEEEFLKGQLVTRGAER